MDKQSIKETLTHPVSVFTGFAATLFADPFVLVDAVLSTIASTSGLWYPLISGFSRLAAMVAWIPAGLVEDVLVAAVVVYVAIYAVRFVRALRENDA